MGEIQIVKTVRINNDQTIRTDVGEFMVVQRNAGFAENDGYWVATLLPDLYWSPASVLRQRHAGYFLGVFRTDRAVADAITLAEPAPPADRMVV